MTESERAQVVAALEAALSLIDQIDFETGTIVAGALAIMRREDRASQAGDIPDFGHPVGLPHP